MSWKSLMWKYYSPSISLSLLAIPGMLFMLYMTPSMVMLALIGIFTMFHLQVCYRGYTLCRAIAYNGRPERFTITEMNKNKPVVAVMKAHPERRVTCTFPQHDMRTGKTALSRMPEIGEELMAYYSRSAPNDALVFEADCFRP